MKPWLILAFGGGLLFGLLWLSSASPVAPFVGLTLLIALCQGALAKSFSGWRTYGLILTFMYGWMMTGLSWLFGTVIHNILLLQVVESLFYSIPVFGAWLFARRMKSRVLFYPALITFWLAFEFIQHRWELAYPLFSLGYAFAEVPELIQWYAITGVAGGSLWSLVISVAIYELLRFWATAPTSQMSRLAAGISATILIILIPIALSHWMSEREIPSVGEKHVLVLHSNIDNYKDKYRWGNDSLISYYLHYTLPELEPQTDLVIWPETALSEGGWAGRISENAGMVRLQEELIRPTGATLLTGAIFYVDAEEVPDGEKSTWPPREDEKTGKRFFTYNAATLVDGRAEYPVYKKYWLTAFEEFFPYPRIFGFLRKVVPSLGKHSFLRPVNDANNLTTEDSSSIGVLICYETAFGQSARAKTQKGAHFLVNLLNEGWYHDQRGARQLLRTAQVRSIENHRSMLRSANDGISAVISPRGEILQIDERFGPSVIKTSVPLIEEKTYFNRNGDWIGYRAVLMSLVLLALMILSWWRERRLRFGPVFQNKKP